MKRIEYCPCDNDAPDPCPACGATLSGDDPVRGICQAESLRYPFENPKIILVHRDTGEPVNKQ